MKLHDIIQFAFKCVHLGITIGSEILHLDLAGLGSFFDLFKLYFFLDFYPLTFYLLEIELNLFSYSIFFCGVVMFSFDLLRIDI